MGGRPSKLSDPAFLKRVATCFYNGMGRDSMCTELGVLDPDTITRWRRDARVKAIVSRLNEDRVIQISRKVDNIVEGRLAHAEKMDTETLIKIRKEYGGGVVARKEADEGSTIAEAMSKLAEDPHFADKLEAFVKKEREQAETTKDEEQLERDPTFSELKVTDDGLVGINADGSEESLD